MFGIMVYTFGTLDTAPEAVTVQNVTLNKSAKEESTSELTVNYPTIGSWFYVNNADGFLGTSLKKCPESYGLLGCTSGNFANIYEKMTFKGLVGVTDSNTSNTTKYAQFRSNCTGGCIRDNRLLYLPVNTTSSIYTKDGETSTLIAGMRKDSDTIDLYGLTDSKTKNALVTDLKTKKVPEIDSSCYQTGFSFMKLAGKCVVGYDQVFNGTIAWV